MTELDPEVEQQLADMPEADFDALIARVRPPEEPADPKARAAAALRREMGANVRGKKPSKEAAAAALRRYANGR
ncbi:hypothetical protein [Mycobacterium celatum]|nr:hypothetical protein [Mycobacterium celatum]